MNGISDYLSTIVGQELSTTTLGVVVLNKDSQNKESPRATASWDTELYSATHTQPVNKLLSSHSASCSDPFSYKANQVTTVWTLLSPLQLCSPCSQSAGQHTSVRAWPEKGSPVVPHLYFLTDLLLFFCFSIEREIEIQRHIS